ERVVGGRDLPRLRVLQVDEEPGGLDRDRRVDREPDHREHDQQGDGGHAPPEDESGHYSPPSGSNASRSPSPSWLNVKTVMKIISEGKIVSHTCVRSELFVTVGLRTEPQTAASRLPQLGVGSLMPTPRKVMPASSS